MKAKRILRTLPELQKEYVSLCTKAGELQYKLAAFKLDLDAVNKQLMDINFEAATVQAADKTKEIPSV